MVKVNHDLTKILKPKYANKWVALNPEQTKVLAASKSPKGLLKIVEEKGYKNPIITYAVADYRVFIS